MLACPSPNGYLNLLSAGFAMDNHGKVFRLLIRMLWIRS